MTMAEGRPPVMAASRLQTQLSRFPSSLLDRPCLESHLGKLVRLLSSEAALTWLIYMTLQPTHMYIP